jgi:SpoVK/Ycf46/Vps4 family AAA+-type ATPase
MLVKLFPTKIHLQQPQEEPQLADWNRQLEHDTEMLKAEANRQQLRMVMGASNVECDDLASIDIRTYLLTKEMSEKVVGWGISHHLQRKSEPVLRNNKLVVEAESLQHSLAELQSVQRSPTSRKKSLKDVVTDNEFEKMLLPEVIPPDELGVTFDHIGALDNVKETLRELVMLPLQRPELFVKGQLTKPCRGLLLFGPPGTGKTMLAKAVATEAGANFINISMSTIASKWFGEAEKYVKAVFTLASKISPSVIFIDEVDSMLGRRGKDTEHSAMRKLKNEFMASWDGLRTRERERVLVLAATNRPFDLDEAVIRRFPRRLMIDLPDADNRAKIMKVILAEEDLAPDFHVEELAAATDGYSGSDLKSLCTTAAYSRIRELLDQEKKDKEAAKAKGVDPPEAEAGVTPYIRPLTTADMRQAMEKVRSSVASDAGSMMELQQWNEQYGEGGTGKKTTLSYFM